MARQIHQSLLSEPLFVGVTRPFVYGELVAAVVMIAVLGYSAKTVLIAALVFVPLHSVMAFLCAKDPEAPQILASALRYRGFYPATGTVCPVRVGKLPALLRQ